MLKAKILMLGPCQSGKTVLSNFLSDSTDSAGGDYQPTQGVRILEFEVPSSDVKSRTSVEVELWDVSGDKKFETCWPAIARDVNGIVFVYNPDQSNHDKELEYLFTYFAEQGALKENQCIVFSHVKPRSTGDIQSELPSSFSRITTVQTNLDEDGEAVRDAFNKFLATLVTALSDKREEEELSIINQR
ncbi:intraflagellar transport protein 22 homolog isoform X3 [Patella vulgata]|uniref:intraflagellar transport protein 22 homolog isoform X3 n=1 Tax=Patella vulgata TaxID=6465 RepID=UPI0024A96CBB|nr:intraflagellar transport protein 22 homolog isoform X3 [Patella vulgata]